MSNLPTISAQFRDNAQEWKDFFSTGMMCMNLYIPNQIKLEFLIDGTKVDVYIIQNSMSFILCDHNMMMLNGTLELVRRFEEPFSASMSIVGGGNMVNFNTYVSTITVNNSVDTYTLAYPLQEEEVFQKSTINDIQETSVQSFRDICEFTLEHLPDGSHFIYRGFADVNIGLVLKHMSEYINTHIARRRR